MDRLASEKTYRQTVLVGNYTDMDSSTLRDRIRLRRKALKMTQIQLALKVGTTQTSIARLESGETESPRAIGAIAKALDTTVEYLQGHTDDPGSTSGPLVLVTTASETPVMEPTVEYDAAGVTGASISTYGAQPWYEALERVARGIKPTKPEWAWRDVRETHPARSSRVPITPRTLADLAQFYWENYPVPPDAEALEEAARRK